MDVVFELLESWHVRAAGMELHNLLHAGARQRNPLELPVVIIPDKIPLADASTEARPLIN